MIRTSTTDQICRDCWERAIYAWGTGELFLKRTRLYTRLLQALAFFGIIVPLLIGGVVVAFGSKAPNLETLIVLAAIAGIAQLFFSAWSIVFNWADSLQYSLESASDNFDLSAKFKELGEHAKNPPDDLQVRYAGIKARDDARRMADAKKAVTPKELRFAHRAGLRQFGRACDNCKEIPRSMDATKCATCGRF